MVFGSSANKINKINGQFSDNLYESERDHNILFKGIPHLLIRCNLNGDVVDANLNPLKDDMGDNMNVSYIGPLLNPKFLTSNLQKEYGLEYRLQNLFVYRDKNFTRKFGLFISSKLFHDRKGEYYFINLIVDEKTLLSMPEFENNISEIKEEYLAYFDKFKNFQQELDALKRFNHALKDNFDFLEENLFIKDYKIEDFATGITNLEADKLKNLRRNFRHYQVDLLLNDILPYINSNDILSEYIKTQIGKTNIAHQNIDINLFTESQYYENFINLLEQEKSKSSIFIGDINLKDKQINTAVFAKKEDGNIRLVIREYDLLVGVKDCIDDIFSSDKIFIEDYICNNIDKPCVVNQIKNMLYNLSKRFEIIYNHVSSNNIIYVDNMKQLKILIVDDQKIIHKLFGNIIKKFNIQNVDFAENGQEALYKVEQNNYHIIFMDHQMPKMNGFEATSILRKNGFKNIIVSISANIDELRSKSEFQKIFDDFIGKPISVKQIGEILKKFVSLERGCLKKISNDPVFLLNGLPFESEQKTELTPFLNLRSIEKEDDLVSGDDVSIIGKIASSTLNISDMRKSSLNLSQLSAENNINDMGGSCLGQKDSGDKTSPRKLLVKKHLKEKYSFTEQIELENKNKSCCTIC